MLIRAALPADAPGMARVVVDTWRSTYRGLLPDTILDNLSYAQRTETWARHIADPENSIFVAATPAGAIVGVASGGPDRPDALGYAGELYAIYLLAAYQGQGLGRRLTAAVAQRLAERGLTSMLVWVLASNPARRFYESLGGAPLPEREMIFGGVPLALAGYGWRDTRPLYAGS